MAATEPVPHPLHVVVSLTVCTPVKRSGTSLHAMQLVCKPYMVGAADESLPCYFKSDNTEAGRLGTACFWHQCQSIANYHQPSSCIPVLSAYAQHQGRLWAAISLQLGGFPNQPHWQCR